MHVTLDSRVVRSPEPMTAMAGHEVLMFSAEQSRYYGLNTVASAIWDRLDAPTRVRDLCADLSRTFAVTPEQCERDVISFVELLAAKGLVEVLGEPR